MEYWDFLLLLEVCIAIYFIAHYLKHKEIAQKMVNEAQEKIKNAEEEATKAAETAGKITNHKYEIELQRLQNEITMSKRIIDEYQTNYDYAFSLQNRIEELNEIDRVNTKKITTQKNKLSKMATALKNAKKVLDTYFDGITDDKIINYQDIQVLYDDYGIDYFDENVYPQFTSIETRKINIQEALKELNEFTPIVDIPTGALDYADLKIKLRDNRAMIKKAFKEFEGRYTTKSNRAKYQLMIIALQAELQNVLFNLKYTNYDKSITLIKTLIARYLSVASEGNQTIKPTMLRFIGEMEQLFIDAIKLEYEYYVRKEKMKEEQRAIKEKMRQEALELKALKEEREKLLREENKYMAEIEAVKEKLKQTIEQGTIILLQNRIKELEEQLASIFDKKEQIINLQNGRAGYVYVISNLGSFGENVFKIGMTRRLNPQERVDELGDASVPFKFDVHSFIFSEDAVGLENELHKRLDLQRVNKMTIRKEFFYSSIDELEKLVLEIQPTAAFCKTMLAEQYRQSLMIAQQFAQNENCTQKTKSTA